MKKSVFVTPADWPTDGTDLRNCFRQFDGQVWLPFQGQGPVQILLALASPGPRKSLGVINLVVRLGFHVVCVRRQFYF
jgi:hypothetical protein